MAHKMPQSTLSTIFRRAFLRVSDECNEAIVCVAEVWSELSEFPAIVTGLFRTEVKRSINKRFYKWYMRSRRPIL